MTAAVDSLLAEARSMPLDAAFVALGFALPKRRVGLEYVMACPICGGKDRFSLNVRKGKWNCRGAQGGNDAIGMAAHLRGFDLKTRTGLIEAAAAALGVAPTAAGETETERIEREKRLAAKRRASREKADGQLAAQDRYRDRERAKAAGKWSAALPIAGSPVESYLRARTGGGIDGVGLRFIADEPYWVTRGAEAHSADRDARRDVDAIHSGPAMIGPFVTLNEKGGAGEIIGCHLTWLDLARPPKFRPLLKHGELAGSEPVELPTKKMRGTKKGGLIPLKGDMASTRWVIGEGIENVLAVAYAESGGVENTADSFYAAAGDLGNLAGPGELKGRIGHPELRQANGKPVMLPSPFPRETQEASSAAGASGKQAQSPDEAMPVPAHVTEILIVCDGDSETLFTAAMTARAVRRLALPVREINCAWPPAGKDFCDLMAEAA